MQNLELPHSKLFYFIAQLQKRDLINEFEKLSLKALEMVITERLEMFQYLEKFERDGNEERFIDNLVGLVRQKDIVQMYRLNLRNASDEQLSLDQELYQGNSDYQFPGGSQGSEEVKAKEIARNDFE